MWLAALISAAAVQAPRWEADEARARSAWTQGRLAEAGQAALDAYSALDAQSCQAPAALAPLAYMIGVAQAAERTEPAPTAGFFFWIAARTDALYGGSVLSEAERAAAEAFAAAPGVFPDDDAAHAASPFFPEEPERCGGETVPLAHPSSPLPVSVLLADVDASAGGRGARRIDPLWAYPPDAMEDLAETVARDRRLFPGSEDGPYAFVFDPCWGSDDASGRRVELCPESAAR